MLTLILILILMTTVITTGNDGLKPRSLTQPNLYAACDSHDKHRSARYNVKVESNING